MAKYKNKKQSKTRVFFERYFTWKNALLSLVIAVAVNNYSIIRLLLDQDQSVEFIIGSGGILISTLIMIFSTVFRVKE